MLAIATKTQSLREVNVLLKLTSFSLFQSTKKSTLLGLQHNKKSVNRIGRH